MKDFWKSLMTPFHWRRPCWLEKLWHVAIVAVVHAVTSRMTEKAIRLSGTNSQIWPATGVAWAMVELVGYYVWPGTFVALLYDDMIIGVGLPKNPWLKMASGSMIAMASLVQSLLGVYALQLIRRRNYIFSDACEAGCGCGGDESMDGGRPLFQSTLQWQYCKRKAVCKRRLALAHDWSGDTLPRQQHASCPTGGMLSWWYCGDRARKVEASSSGGHGNGSAMFQGSSRSPLSGHLTYDEGGREVLVPRQGMDSMMEASWFFFVGISVCALTNIVTVVTLVVVNKDPWSTFLPLYLSWWLGDVSGLLVMYPLAMAFHQPALRMWKGIIHTAKAARDTVSPALSSRHPHTPLPDDDSESCEELLNIEEGMLDHNLPFYFSCSHIARRAFMGMPAVKRRYEEPGGEEGMCVWHNWATMSQAKMWRVIEVTLLFTGLVVTITVIFGELTKSYFVWPLPYLVLPFVIWAAFRFNRQVLSLTLFILMLGVTLASQSYKGPFSLKAGPVQTNLHIQIFVCVVCVMGMSLSAAVRERRQFAEQLYHINNTLEHQVLRRTEQLQVSQQMAEAASQAKSEFLANMSHEIRTPIHGIMGITQLVMETPLDDEQRENLGTVLRSCEWLLETVNSILDLSKIEAGRQEVEHLRFNLRAYLDGTRKMLQNKFKEKGVELRWQVDPDMPRCVVGDPAKINHCVINLLGNALKFTSAGHVTLRVEKLDKPIPIGTSITGAPVGLPPHGSQPVRRIQETGTKIEGSSHSARRDHYCSSSRLPEACSSLPLQHALLLISVADTGIGIRKEKLQDVFQPFVQADTSTTRLYGGTGLGLTIVERVVRMLGGTMWVESEEGVGTTFFFTTEVQLVPETSEPQPPEVSESAGERATSASPAGQSASVSTAEPVLRERFHGLRVLLAEDNLVNQKVACGQLKKCGMTVSIAHNGKEAMEAILHDPNAFDIILMDVQMPEMDGLEATMLIRQEEMETGRRRLPILGLTAHAIEGYKQKCMEAGMDGYCTKPFKLVQMLTAMHNVLPPLPVHTEQHQGVQEEQEQAPSEQVTILCSTACSKVPRIDDCRVQGLVA